MSKQLTLNLVTDETVAVDTEIKKPIGLPEDIKNVRWNQLLHEAIRQPGMLHTCYSTFYNYSLGNLFLAACQLSLRGLDFGPLATFENWKRQGRHVKKGERAISLWMPIVISVKKKNEETGEEEPTGQKRAIFALKSNWFALTQTDGKDYEPEGTPDWDFEKALAGLKINLVKFDFNKVPDGNCQGYAYKRNIAINPTCQKVMATQLHEMAHVVLGHTEKTELIADVDLTRLPRCIKELEAESTAMLCLDALGRHEMTVFNRGYIQHWLEAGNVTEIPEDSAKRIFAAADKILKAGQVKAGKLLAEAA